MHCPGHPRHRVVVAAGRTWAGVLPVTGHDIIEPMSDDCAGADRDPLTRIVETARRLFAERGVSATRLEDVAQEVGMPRQYLYRYVSGRAELLEHALTARCSEIGEELATGADVDVGNLSEAIIDKIIAGVSKGRDDEEFSYLTEGMGRERVNAFLTSMASPLHAINTRIFAPLLGSAMAAGMLRTDVSVGAMVGWLQGVMTMLAGRHDLDSDELRQTVEKFVLPSLLA